MISQGRAMDLRYLLLITTACLSLTVTAQSWVYDKQEDGFSDTTLHTALLDIPNSKSLIVVRCQGINNFDIVLSLNTYIGSNSDYPVRYRFDKNSVNASAWNVSTKGTALFVKDNEAVEFARNLIKGKELLVEVTDFRNTPHSQTFSLVGATDPVGKVLKACDIPLSPAGFDLDPTRITDTVRTAVDRWLPQQIKCNKASLSALGYEIGEPGNQANAPTYYSMQVYFGKTYLDQCGPDTQPTHEKSVDCQSREIFMSSRVITLLQREAAAIDQNVKAQCK
jgi:hypothetical protein